MSRLICLRSNENDLRNKCAATSLWKVAGNPATPLETQQHRPPCEVRDTLYGFGEMTFEEWIDTNPTLFVPEDEDEEPAQKKLIPKAMKVAFE